MFSKLLHFWWFNSAFALRCWLNISTKLCLKACHLAFNAIQHLAFISFFYALLTQKRVCLAKPILAPETLRRPLSLPKGSGRYLRALENKFK